MPYSASAAQPESVAGDDPEHRLPVLAAALADSVALLAAVAGTARLAVVFGDGDEGRPRKPVGARRSPLVSGAG
ncbi:hypothetical protein QTQ03_21570 [Micromonospora sp. WMMA1363]|uniref:hypothetical protein n=1 Tax=Micromonospora sp. WMMA1363 TaxID=3053985 RepID=UPI00259D0A67|nr:hypothetical protein [Micromonospora sp. WMMA1363]MDM4722049.1 hypothetical protein [Micromonospora sp. WMMA1363]